VNIDKEFDLTALAEEAGMSEFHFSRLFKQTTGFSPLQYLTQRRIALARQLLRETDKSMIEIALEIGYSSPNHFAQISSAKWGLRRVSSWKFS
jgi:AraC family transcriptional regulator